MPLEDLTPSNRFELSLSGDMTAEEASNRIEKILAGADIEPSNRLEYFLKLRVSGGGGGGGGDDSPMKFEYLGTFKIFDGDGWRQIGAVSPFDTGIVINNVSQYFAVIAIPSQTNAVPDDTRTGNGVWFRTANYCSHNNAYCSGWDDTTMREYVDASGKLILDSINYNFTWQGPYYVYGIKLQED